MKVFLQLFLVILSTVFFRYISEILCPYIPPCLSDKCGFRKFYEVHSFMKLTRYLLKNINTWFLKSDIVLICLPVYFHLFQWWCVGEGSEAVKRSACSCTSGLCFCIIFIFLRFCRPTFIYNWFLKCLIFKCTVMKIEKAVPNDPLRVSKVPSKFHIPTLSHSITLIILH